MTLGAGVFLLIHMSFCMCSQVYSLEKSLFTHKARVGLLSRMDSTVFVQGDGQREGLATGGAGECLISCVCPLVTLQGPRHRESLVTLKAGIWFLPCVESSMYINGKRTLCAWSRSKEFHHCVSSCDSSVEKT